MIENIFSTPIYSTIINDNGIVKEEVQDAIEKTKFDMREDWGNTHYLSDVTFIENNFIEDNGLTNLKNQIFHHLNEYIFLIGAEESNPTIVESWASLFKKNSYGHIHNHGCVDFSGVYYHKTNGVDGNIFFCCPVPCADTSQYFKHIGSRFYHQPVVGKLILFPGWLHHGIEKNQTDNERISISFNICMPRYSGEKIL